MENFRNFPNCKINIFPKIYNMRNSQIHRIFTNFENQNLAPKIRKFWNCSFIRYSALLASSLIFIFALCYKSTSMVKLLNLYFLFFQFEILTSILHFFIISKLFEHPKYGIWQFLKLTNFENLIFSKINQLEKFLEFSWLEIFWFFHIRKCLNFPNCKIN